MYGRGRSVYPRDQEWARLSGHFPDRPGTRQIVVLDIASVQTSCGFGVPLYEYTGQRDVLLRWAEEQGADGVAAYQRRENAVSIDGLATGLPL